MDKGDLSGNGAEFSETKEEKAQGLGEHRGDRPERDAPREGGRKDGSAIAEPDREEEWKSEGDEGDRGGGGGGERERKAPGALHPGVFAAGGRFGVGGPERAEEEGVALLRHAQEALQDGESGAGAVAAEAGERERGESLDGGADETGGGEGKTGAPEAAHFGGGGPGGRGPGESTRKVERGGEAGGELAGAKDGDDGHHGRVGGVRPNAGSDHGEQVGESGPRGVHPTQLDGGGEAGAGGEGDAEAGGERDDEAGDGGIEVESGDARGRRETAGPPRERGGDCKPRRAEEAEETEAARVSLPRAGEIAARPRFGERLLQGHRHAEVGKLRQGDEGQRGHHPAEGIGAEPMKEEGHEGELAEAGDHAGQNLRARVLPDEPPAAPAGTHGVGGIRRGIHGRGDGGGEGGKYKARAAEPVAFRFARMRRGRKCAGVSVTLALSTLCENPRRRTGLTTLFHEFVTHALRLFPDVNWIVFVGPGALWNVHDARVTVVREFPANDRRGARLWADHFCVGPAARAGGAAALLTVGFAPVRSAGLPVVMHVFSLHHLHAGAGVMGALGALYRRWAVGRGLKRAALVIVNSRWTAAQLAREGRGAAGRTLVSHEGLDHKRFRPEAEVGEKAMRVRWGLPEEYVLWASNFYGYKRVPLAIAAYARMAGEVRARFPLVLVGGDWAGGRTEAERVARGAGVERDVRFLGWVDDAVLPAIYRGARAHVLATREETFGRSVTEAMACGCPCVLQDLPVLREVAEGAAVWVDFGDAAAAGAAVERVCADDLHAERLRQAGLARAAAFSFEQLARERVTSILEVLTKGESRR